MSNTSKKPALTGKTEIERDTESVDWSKVTRFIRKAMKFLGHVAIYALAAYGLRCMNISIPELYANILTVGGILLLGYVAYLSDTK